MHNSLSASTHCAPKRDYMVGTCLLLSDMAMFAEAAQGDVEAAQQRLEEMVCLSVAALAALTPYLLVAFSSSSRRD